MSKPTIETTVRIPRVRVAALAAGLALVLAPLSAEAGRHGDRYDGRSAARGAFAEVIDVRPQYDIVRREIPREVCHTEEYRQPRGQYSATAPVLGAVVGGAIGNAVGHRKRNKQVGAVIGALLGGAIGHDIARRNEVRGGGYEVESRDVCRVETSYQEEERLSGYEVTYRYGGETYTTVMDRDPGRRLRVDVDVRPAEGNYTGGRWR